jgi:hypothetical protein
MNEKRSLGERNFGSLPDSEIGSRLIVAERYADCIRRLARASSDIDRPDLAEQLQGSPGASTAWRQTSPQAGTEPKSSSELVA